MIHVRKVYKITVNAYNPGIVRTKMRDAIDKKIAKIKHETIESLKRAYDEYLLLLSKKEDITKIVNAPFPLSRHLKKNREELISILKNI